MAAHWTSATRSWFISFFHSLTSHIPSLAPSCNDQIPIRTTSSASRDGASTTCCSGVDDSICVVLDVSLPADDGALRTSNTSKTGSTMTTGSSQAGTFNSSPPSLVHLIASVFQRQQLGKAVLGFAFPLTMGLLFEQHEWLTPVQASTAILALSFGFTTTWNGMLLHEMYPQFATALEYFGAVSVLVTFFGLVSSFLPPSLMWAGWLCCGLSCLPFLLCLVLPTAVEAERSSERPYKMK